MDIKAKLSELAENKCGICQETFYDDEMTIDHIKPSSKGGEDSILNYAPVCRKCNSKKSNTDLLELMIGEADENGIWHNYYKFIRKLQSKVRDELENDPNFIYSEYLTKGKSSGWDKIYDNNLEFSSQEALDHYIKWLKVLRSKVAKKQISPQAKCAFRTAACKNGVLFKDDNTLVILSNCVDEDEFREQLSTYLDNRKL